MKRYISLFLVLPVILAATVIPARAAEANYGIYNLLDYGQIFKARIEYFNFRDEYIEADVAFNGNKVVVPEGSGTLYIYFYNPGISNIYGVSALINIYDFSELSFTLGEMTLSDTGYSPNTKFMNITFADLTGSNGFNEDYAAFEFEFEAFSGAASLEFLSCYVKTAYDSTVRSAVEIYDVVHGTSVIVPSGSASYDYTVNVNNEVVTDAGSFSLRLRPLAQEGTYDFFDLSFEVTGLQIQSITCMQGDKALDFDVGYTYLDTDGSFIYGSDFDSLEIASNTFGRYWVSVRVYTKAANFIEGWPLVFLDGFSAGSLGDGQSWNIRFYPSYVSYNVSILDPYVMWLNKIYMALHPDNSIQQEQLESAVQEQVNEFDNLIDTMDSVQRPALDDIPTSMNAVAPGIDILSATAPIRSMLSNDLILTVFSMSLLFCTASYVLFGKKDF